MSLNSNDAFVLKLPNNTGYTWVGKGVNKEEEQGAQYIASVLKCQTAKINEGQEPGWFEAMLFLMVSCGYTALYGNTAEMFFTIMYFVSRTICSLSPFENLTQHFQMEIYLELADA